jgi:hypothetical protein
VIDWWLKGTGSHLVSGLCKTTVWAARIKYRHKPSGFHVDKVRELGKRFLCASRFLITSTTGNGAAVERVDGAADA